MSDAEPAAKRKRVRPPHIFLDNGERARMWRAGMPALAVTANTERRILNAPDGEPIVSTFARAIVDNNGNVVARPEDIISLLAGGGGGATTNASLLTTGTLPDGRFPATLPAVSGANLTGNIAAARLAAATVGGTLVFVTTTVAIAASDINWALGNQFSKTLGANTTFTFSNTADGQSIVAALTNTASNYTVTWPTVSWSGGAAPIQTTGAKTDIYTFIKIGSVIYGSALQDF